MKPIDASSSIRLQSFNLSVEILRLHLQGSPARGIARQLGLSPSATSARLRQALKNPRLLKAANQSLAWEAQELEHALQESWCSACAQRANLCEHL